MKKFNHSFLKFCNVALAAVLGLFGFQGCIRYEYGTPMTDFVLKGQITNKADKKPLKNIYVGFEPLRIVPEYGVPQTDYSYLPTTFTDENGNYELLYNGFSLDYTSDVDTIYVYDGDGEENGGQFVAGTIAVDWSESRKTKKSDNDWYQGEYTVTKNIELEEEK
ncbi:MAG: radical SAM-associated putative lipoprotein [Bacteroidales bacterium]|jgi:putative lipoprotein (rSAM/lipoprotein system)|nr:radical SAM-associated putative lipoprotein [Bacteroidales bacterium]